MRKTEHLIGKCAIVTGAAGGIGEYICRKLAADYKMDLVITGRKRETLNRLAEELRGYGVRVCECIGDLNELDFVDTIIKRKPLKATHSYISRSNPWFKIRNITKSKPRFDRRIRIFYHNYHTYY